MFKKLFFGQDFDVPSLEQALPELADARDLKNRVQTEASQVKIDIATERASNQRGIAEDGKDGRVTAILAGLPYQPKGDTTRLVVLLRRLTDLNAAIDSQSSKIAALEREASILICEKLRSEHDRLAADLCAKLIEAYHAHATYLGLQNALTDQGIRTTSLQPLTSRILEHPGDRYSGLSYLLKEAREHGIIQQSTIPEAIRQ